MSLLETKYAAEIIRMLEKEQSGGAQYVVLEMRNRDMQLRANDLEAFTTLEEVLDHIDEKEDYGQWLHGEEYSIYYQPIGQMLEEIREANSLTHQDTMQHEARMTRDAFKNTLTAAGYRQGTIQHGLLCFDLGTYPQFSIKHQEFTGYDLFTVMLDFETNGMDIRFQGGHAGLLHVPVAHQQTGGVDTAKLEERMALVNWSWDHPFIAGELPGDAEVNHEARVVVPGIYNDLASLYTHSPEGKLLAEQLCCRHIIWRMGEDRNSELPDLVGQKYYVSEDLPGIIRPEAARGLVTGRPAADIALGGLIGEFIQRQLTYHSSISQIPIIMNLNNLEDLKNEVRDLGFSAKVADEMEKNMKASAGYFTVKDQFPGDKGVVDMTLHFRKSGQSDNYSLNKFDAVAGQVPPSVPNQHYMVISENKEKPEQPLVRPFDSPNEAIAFFKKQSGTSELAMGESKDAKQNLATKVEGKVNFIEPNFRQAYLSPAINQTFYLKEGEGFSARQAANLVQGRTVHRDNMMTRDGMPYKAWVRLDNEVKKDDYNNYHLKQYNDPAFGFDLEKTLHNYKIKDLADPAKKEAIMDAMRHGDRVNVTAVDKDNKEVKILAEAVPRYSKLDFFNDNGYRQKREQFEKPAVKMDISQGKTQGKGKEKELEESRGMKV